MDPTRERKSHPILLMTSMGRTWEKFSFLAAKKPQKFETATRKANFQTKTEGRTSGGNIKRDYKLLHHKPF